MPDLIAKGTKHKGFSLLIQMIRNIGYEDLYRIKHDSACFVG